jgi:hypothetical protein
VPRVPLPDVGVTFIRETCPASSEDITPRSSLLRTHASIPCGSPLLRLLASFVESSQVATSPCCYPGFSRRYLCESFPRCPSPCPGGLLSAFAWFFPSIHRPSPSFDWVSFPLPSVNTTFHGSAFEAAAISLCSGLRVCSPLRSFPPLQVSPQGSRGFVHPSRTCVVTFARIGHAIRPTTGNWRNENFHLARFAALSAATA